MKHADIAWLALAAGIVIYEAAAPTDQLLSQAVDRYRAKHPFISPTASSSTSPCTYSGNGPGG